LVPWAARPPPRPPPPPPPNQFVMVILESRGWRAMCCLGRMRQQ